MLGTFGEAYAARRYAQETNLAMNGALDGANRAAHGRIKRRRPCNNPLQILRLRAHLCRSKKVSARMAICRWTGLIGDSPVR
jgi:hypothetical protein